MTWQGQEVVALRVAALPTKRGGADLEPVRNLALDLILLFFRVVSSHQFYKSVENVRNIKIGLCRLTADQIYRLASWPPTSTNTPSSRPWRPLVLAWGERVVSQHRRSGPPAAPEKTRGF